MREEKVWNGLKEGEKKREMNGEDRREGKRKRKKGEWGSRRDEGRKVSDRRIMR